MYQLSLTSNYYIWNNYLENCPWANTKPSSRIGNLTSQLPTMFWILNSVNFACENTTKPVLFNQKITGPSLRVVTYLTPVCLMGPWCCGWTCLLLVSFNHKATSVLQVLMWRQQTGDSKLKNTPELDPLEFYWLNILWYK